MSDKRASGDKRTKAGTGSGASRFVVPLAVLVGCVLAALLLIWWGEWPSLRGSPMVAIPLRFVEVHARQQPWRLQEAAPPVREHTVFAGVYGPNVVRQEIRVPADKLRVVRLWMAGPPGQEVRLAFHDLGDQTYVGRAQIVDARGAYYDLRLPASLDSREHRYALEITAPAATRERAISLRFAAGRRLGGQVTLNRYPLPGNLDLTAYHRGFPGRWWLDAMGERLVPTAFRLRLQQYKPPWFKSRSETGAPLGLPFTGLALAGLALSSLAVGGGLWDLPRDRRRRLGMGVLIGVVVALGSCALWTRVQLPGQTRRQPVHAEVDAPSDEHPAAVRAQQPHVVYDLLVHEDETHRDLTRSRHREKAWTELVPGAAGPRAALRMVGSYSLAWRTRIPPDARFRASVVPSEGGSLFRVRLFVDGERATLYEQEIAEASPGGVPLDLDLGRYAGQWVRIELSSRKQGGWWLSPQILTEGQWLLAYPLPDGAAAGMRALPRNRFGQEVELLGYTAGAPDAATSYKPGELVPLSLYWRALGPVDVDYTVFVHLIDEQGRQVTGADSRPVKNAFPTLLWAPQYVVVDERSFPLPADLPAGTYTMRVGLYELESLARLPAYGERDLRLDQDALPLEVKIQVGD